MVTDKPERLSMRTLVALCDILSCTPSDLITPYVETRARRTSGSAAGASAEPSPGQAPVGRGRSTVPAGPRTDHRRRRLTLPPDPLPLTPAEPMT
nr:helix-turn-helix transcriptional regulator [Pseudonocardia sulfidoxydans]